MRLTIGDLRPGAILAEAVRGPGGRQLAAAGTVLTAQHLQVMRIWGIESVEIEQAAPGPDREAMLAAQRTVAARFRGQPTDHPAIRALFAAAVARQLRTTA
jgi:hypothetical protein